MSRLFDQPPMTRELWAFWMYSSDFIGRSIGALTDGVWSHTGLMVYEPDGTANVYEALFAEGKIVKRDAKERFRSFLSKNKDWKLCAVRVFVADNYQTTYDLQEVIRYADSCVGDVIYGRFQLVSMALAQRFGIPVPRSTKKQVCSEFLARCLGGQDNDTASCIVCDLRDPRHQTYDEVTPDSSFRRMMAILAGCGSTTEPFKRTSTPLY
jgi:hypothetical protein